jgi:hypothetical protein
VQFLHYKDFDKSLRSLYKRGGKYQTAAEDILAIVGKVHTGGDPLHGLRRTNHGESRIRHCIKYDLTGFCRLITVQNAGMCFFVFCGIHEECDEWLNRNRGLRPIVDARMMVKATFVSDDGLDVRLDEAAGASNGLLYQRLEDKIYERLVQGVPRAICRKLEALDSTSSPVDLWASVAEVEDPDFRNALRDVFALLRKDLETQAIDRARLLFGEVRLSDSLIVEELPDIIDSDVIRRISPNSPNYASAFKRFVTSANYREWMLFMHPAQEEVVREDFAGPAKLVGVSGSGKTCVVVQRAVRMAQLYPHDKILVLTINRALAALIDNLVAECAPEGNRHRIRVVPFFELCRDLLRDLEPRNARLYDEVTWKTNEHVEAVWQEYYRCDLNNHDARVLQPVHDTLLARNWNPERYLREEIDWLRSALSPNERGRYLGIERKGRAVPLATQFREMILTGTAYWEEKMTTVGVMDGPGIAQALSRHLDRLQPAYRSILVDEAQDFGNVELDIIRRLVGENDNDLFLCGDAAQAVTTKYQSFRDVGIKIPGARSRRLNHNYRNSRDILEAAYHVLKENMTEEMMDREDFELLDPEYSLFSASTPLLLRADNLASEISFASQFCREMLTKRIGGKACIAVCGFSLYELSPLGSELQMPVLDGQVAIEDGSIFLSDLEQTKGFEFDVVCIVNCREDILPNGSAPNSERHRDLARLYVAMTRAKTDLAVSWSGAISPFFEDVDGRFVIADWADYEELEPLHRSAYPKRVEARRLDGMHTKTWREMTGEEFLYTESALGLSPELISKLRELVDGRPIKRGSDTLRWRDLGSAARDYATSAASRRLWGSETGTLFSKLVAKLENKHSL